MWPSAPVYINGSKCLCVTRYGKRSTQTSFFKASITIIITVVVIVIVFITWGLIDVAQAGLRLMAMLQVLRLQACTTMAEVDESISSKCWFKLEGLNVSSHLSFYSWVGTQVPPGLLTDGLELIPHLYLRNSRQSWLSRWHVVSTLPKPSLRWSTWHGMASTLPSPTPSQPRSAHTYHSLFWMRACFIIVYTTAQNRAAVFHSLIVTEDSGHRSRKEWKRWDMALYCVNDKTKW